MTSKWQYECLDMHVSIRNNYRYSMKTEGWIRHSEVKVREGGEKINRHRERWGAVTVGAASIGPLVSSLPGPTVVPLQPRRGQPSRWQDPSGLARLRVLLSVPRGHSVRLPLVLCSAAVSVANVCPLDPCGVSGGPDATPGRDIPTTQEYEIPSLRV